MFYKTTFWVIAQQYHPLLVIVTIARRFEGLEGSCCGPANGELFGFACCSAESMCMEGTDINGGAQYACQAIVAPPGNGATIIVFLLLSFCLASCINCRIYYRNNIYPVFL